MASQRCAMVVEHHLFILISHSRTVAKFGDRAVDEAHAEKPKTKKTIKSPTDAKDAFIELRARGMSYESIACELGVGRQTLQSWSRDLQAEIKNASAVRMDALRAKHRLLQQHQVEVFGELLDKIKGELARRDLAEVPTYRLMDMFLKYSAAFHENSSQPEFVEKTDPIEFAILQATYQSRPMP